MRHRVLGLTAAVAAVLAPMPALADVVLQRNDVIQVTLDDYLSTSRSRRGDRFTATVETDSQLPRGTRFIGQVMDSRRRTEDRPAYLELEFTDIVLPNGSRTPVRAMPMLWDERLLKRDRNGRFKAGGTVIAKQRAVNSGAIAGLVLGFILKKPFEGLVFGTIAGIIVAESQRDQLGRRDVRIHTGTRLGALIEERVTVLTDGYWSDGYDRPYDRDLPRRNDWDSDRASAGRIEYRGRALQFPADEEPYREGRTVMVPLERTASQLDLRVSFAERGDVILVEDEDSLLKLEHGSREYRLNGRRGTLSQEIVRRNGVVYVPIEVLAEMKDDPVRADGFRAGA